MSRTIAGGWGRRRGWKQLALATAVATIALPGVARADRWWNDFSVGGAWSNPNNWAATQGGAGGAGVPGSGDIAYIYQSDSTSRGAALNINASVARVFIGNAGAGATNTLLQTAAVNLQTSSGEIVGYLASNGVHTQSAGTNTPDPYLDVGHGPGSLGTYNLSGSGVVQLLSGRTIYVGDSGTGVVNQTGGAMGVSSTLGAMYIGYGPGSSGTYNLSGPGTMSVNDLQVGRYGSGALNITGGGVSGVGVVGAVVGNAFAGNVTVSDPGSNWTIDGPLTIGGDAAGTVTVSNGAQVSAGSISVGSNSGGNGAVTLNGGSLTASGLIESIGYDGVGTFNQPGGTHTLNPGCALILGDFGGTGTYTLSGSGVLTTSNYEMVGENGTATFNQTGGSNTINNSGHLDIAGGPNSAASYTLSGGTLSTTYLYVGGNNTFAGGTGTFTFNSPGTLNVGSFMRIYAGGTLKGNGTSAAEVRCSGMISPGNSAGTLTVGLLTLNSGSKVLIETGDLLVANGVQVGGPSTIFLKGPFPTPTALINYGSFVSLLNNLSIVGGVAGQSYKPVNDTVNHAVTFATGVPIGRHLQIDTYGQSSPGGAGPDPFSQFQQTFPALNASGQVAFASNLSAISSNQGVFRGNGNSIVAVARRDQAAPGTGGGSFGVFTIPNDGPSINTAGQVAFFAGLAGTSDGSNWGIFRGDGASLISIARQKQPILDGTGAFVSSFVSNGVTTVMSKINTGGQVAFTAAVNGGINPNYTAMLRSDGSTLATIARSGQAAPGGSGTFSDNFGFENGVYNLPTLNNSGQVAFVAQVNGSTSTVGVFRGDGVSPPIAIARQGQSIPAGDGGGAYGYFFNNFDPPAINDSGQVAFNNVDITGAGDGSVAGMFRGNGTSTVLIARHKRSAPGAGGGVFGPDFGAPAMNAAGQVAFGASLSGTSDSSGSGIFRGDGSSLVAIAREKQVAPGTGGATFASFGGGSYILPAAPIASGGQVAFISGLVNAPNGDPFASGLFIGDGQEIVLAALSWQTLLTTQGSRTITGFAHDSPFLGHNPINNFGQVAYLAYLQEGGTGNFLFTPTLHWRSPNLSDPWDVSNNWTLGLTPALVHDVFIDPAGARTVTGPASSRTIRSLTIGGGGAAATLQLGGTGVVLRTLGTLSIDTAGGSKLDLRDSKLITQSPVGSWNGSAYTGLTGLIQSGRNGGPWTGPGIITSQTAATTSNFTSLGVARAADVRPATATATALWAGQTITGTDTLIMYTYGGDATLDGKINVDDYIKIDSGIASNLTGWVNGDFNYDGKVNIDDYTTVIDANIGNQNGVFPTGSNGGDIGGPSGVSAIPEPAAGVLIVGATSLLIRRKRRSMG